MKPLGLLGAVILILGVALLFIPIPHREKQGIKAGDISFGVETRSEEKISPAVCVGLIVVGAGLAIVGRTKG